MTFTLVFGSLVLAERDMMTLLTPLSNLPGSCIQRHTSIVCSTHLSRWLNTNPYLLVEDFARHNARRILERYRAETACFNDDMQGTGCVTLAAIMTGLGVSNVKLADMRMVIFGAGTAGIGIADQVRDAIAAESRKSREDATKQIWC